MNYSINFLPLDHEKRIFHRHVAFFRFSLAHAQKAASDKPLRHRCMSCSLFKDKKQNEVFLHSQMMKPWITHKAPTTHKYGFNKRAGCVLAEVELRCRLHLYNISCHGENCAIMDNLYGKLQASTAQRVLL